MPNRSARSFRPASHIPYVLAHGRAHGTDWLTEVTAESYIPLLDALHGRRSPRASRLVTIGQPPSFASSFRTSRSGTSSWTRSTRTSGRPRRTARRSGAGRRGLLQLAQRAQGVPAHPAPVRTPTGATSSGVPAGSQDAGHVRIITSAATHGYLPLLLSDGCARADPGGHRQVTSGTSPRQPTASGCPSARTGRATHWQAPLAAYQTPEPILRRGVDEFLMDEGIEYTFVDAHLVKGGTAQGVYADRLGRSRRCGTSSPWSTSPRRAAAPSTSRTSSTRPGTRPARPSPCFRATSARRTRSGRPTCTPATSGTWSSTKTTRGGCATGASPTPRTTWRRKGCTSPRRADERVRGARPATSSAR